MHQIWYRLLHGMLQMLRSCGRLQLEAPGRLICCELDMSCDISKSSASAGCLARGAARFLPAAFQTSNQAKMQRKGTLLQASTRFC